MNERDRAISTLPRVKKVYELIGKIKSILSEDAIKAIRQAARYVADKSAAELSEITHEYSVSWNNTGDGQEQQIYQDIPGSDASESLKLLDEFTGWCIETSRKRLIHLDLNSGLVAGAFQISIKL